MKRLNNRGWGEKDMMLYCGIIAVILLVIYILLNQFNHMMDTPKDSSTIDKNVKEEINEATTPGVIIDEDTEDQEPVVVDDNYYHALEDSLEIASKAYIERQYEEIQDDTIMHITLEQLTSLDFIDQVKDPNGNICSGYVTYTSSDETYKPYLDCGDYTTEGYETQYE